MGGDECISASRGPIGCGPVAVGKIVFIGGVLDHTVQRDMFANCELSHFGSPCSGIAFLSFPAFTTTTNGQTEASQGDKGLKGSTPEANARIVKLTDDTETKAGQSPVCPPFPSGKGVVLQARYPRTIRCGGFNKKPRLPGQSQEVSISGDQQVGLPTFGEVEE